MSLQGSLSIEHMCALAQVSRAGFYRFLEQEHGVEQQDMELRSLIQKMVLQHKHRYGYRRIAKLLRREGLVVNRKRVQRIMQEDNLLALQKRKFVVTTHSNHRLQVRLNLAARMQLTGINQLWVADITYIRLLKEFVYLAVILDAFSRKVIGWALGRDLSRALTLAALRQALEQRQPLPGLVHHSDRGLQYACADYVNLLQQHHVLLSMSRAGNPYDNAICESFIKSLKREEIYPGEYRDLEDLRAQLEEFLERYYNRYRLHSALCYQSPEEFEQQQFSSTQPALDSYAAGLSFSGMGKSIEAMGSRRNTCSPTHSVDESPVGYSLAGCSPAEPASASPTGAIVHDNSVS
jgi:transposase InsO family protein